ncbi:hypothetical protein ACRAKI_00870 [Saccharothrix isguenensis]
MQIPPGFTLSGAAQPVFATQAPVGDVPVPGNPVLGNPVAGQPVAAPPAPAQPAPASPVDPSATVTLPAGFTGAPVAAAPISTAAVPTEPAGAEPAVTPLAGESFAKAAQTDLAKATTALDAVDKQSVQLDLDKQGVEDLVKLISQARSLVDNVHSRAVNNLDVELKFGNNWVSDAISRRLREVAVGNEESAVKVIGDFMQVLFEVEETIREAARNLERADDEAANAFRSAGEAKG